MFPGTNISFLIATSYRRIDSCSTLSCLNPKSLHISCILIGLQQPSEKCFPPIHIAKALLKNSPCGPDTAIDRPGTSSEYTRCPNIVYSLGLMKLSTMDPHVLPQFLSTVVANDVSKLSLINASGGGFFLSFLFSVPWENNFLCPLNPWPYHNFFCFGTLSLSVGLGVRS